MKWNRPRVVFAFAAIAGLTAGVPAEGQQGKDRDQASEKQRMIAKVKDKAPAMGYLEAHRDIEGPMKLLGGPVTVSIQQTEGGVHVALPAHRRIDERVFGTPEHPQRIGGTPVITGLPTMMRQTKDGRYTHTTELTPFGDKSVVMKNGRLDVRLIDATATDAATSEDTVRFTASWQDDEDNTYKVACNVVMPHGLEYPTFGGVVTNHLLHGISGVGTPLMPTIFAYAAFWGTGDVMKNGEVIDENRAVHGMLTEYVRTDDYSLAFDHEVTPTKLHFHLMVAPVAPDKSTGHFKPDPVETGFTLPNGQTLPFWHVMFQNLEIDAGRL